MGEFVTLDVHNEFVKRIEDENDWQNRRIQKLENSVEQITKLTVSVERMAISMEHMASELKTQGVRLSNIEDKPAKRWDTVISCIVTGIVGAIMGAVMAGIIR